MRRILEKRRRFLMAGVLFLIMIFAVVYRTVTPQDRFFIHLEESDIDRIILYNYRTRAEAVELSENDRRTVAEQLLRVELKGGWTVLDVLNGGTTKMYHIVLEDGREFDFAALFYYESEPHGTLRACPYYIINDMRAYETSKKNVELVEQMNETWQKLAEQYYPVDESITDE